MPRLGTRWVVGAVVVLVAAALFVSLGMWQLRRLDERRAFEREVAAGLARPPVPLAEASTEPYRRVEVRGSFVPGTDVALLGRALDGEPGNHVLTLLRADDGSTVIVDRGWVPYDPAGGIPQGAEAPDGEVTVLGVTVRTRDDPEIDGRSRTVRDVDPDAFGAVPRLRAQVYVQLSRQDPPHGAGPPGGALPRPAPFELQPASPHLSYAVQWFAFAAIAVAGYAVLVWREGRRGARLDTSEPFGDDAARPDTGAEG